MMPSSTSPFKVIIVGGGVAGLSMAHALTLAKIDYVVLEKRDRVAEPSGACLGIWPHSMPILTQFGVLKTLTESHTPLRVAYHMDPSGETITSFPFFEKQKEKIGQAMEMYERYQVLNTLYEKLPDRNSRIRTGCTVSTIEQDQSGVTVHVEGGEEVKGDIVIGADGVHSKVREIMWMHAKAHISNEADRVNYKTQLTTRYKCLFGLSEPLPHEEEGAMIETHNEGFSFHIFVLRDLTAWFLYKKLEKPVTWPDRTYYTEADAAALAEEHGSCQVTKRTRFKDLWESRRRTRLAGIEEGVQSRWHSGRIVLLGDAAHKMTPNLGWGANNALESVTILTNLLIETLNNESKSLPVNISGAEIEKIFSTYQAQRFSRANLHYRIMEKFTSAATWETKFDKFMTYLPQWTGGWFETLILMVMIMLGNRAPKGLTLPKK